MISYVQAAMALKEAKKVNAIEAIYINRKTEVLEGTTSNLFAFLGNTMVTPAEGILKGITRNVILSLAADHFDIEQRPLTLKELLSADEVFITGTNKCIVPVVQIDDTVISDKGPGKNTKIIMDALDRHTKDFINNELT